MTVQPTAPRDVSADELNSIKPATDIPYDTIIKKRRSDFFQKVQTALPDVYLVLNDPKNKTIQKDIVQKSPSALKIAREILNIRYDDEPRSWKTIEVSSYKCEDDIELHEFLKEAGLDEVLEKTKKPAHSN